MRPRRSEDKQREGGQVPLRATSKPSGAPREAVFRCFRCNQPGHRAAECPAPSPRKPTTSGRATPMKTAAESSRAATQQATPGVRRGSPATPEPAAAARYQPGDDEDSPDDGSADPMKRERLHASAIWSSSAGFTDFPGRYVSDANVWAAASDW
ncbi:hypothetical protein NXF25_018993 [Crotalus adamanteus]|uniref:CCHC-type domain-containing protein n=1 Tax=Crotalus adamanteus TaxID=8729 RepID=A0AAW1B138_CROAD